MKKIIALVLLISIAFSVKSAGMYGDYSVIFSDSYVAKVPYNLGQDTSIMNSYSVTTNPRITINDMPADFLLEVPTGLFDAPGDKYVIEKREIISDMEISNKVTIEDGQIVSDVSVRNGGPNPAKVDIDFALRGHNDEIFSMFSPDSYNKTSNYIALFQKDYDGPALAVMASQDIKPSFIGIYDTKEYLLYFSVQSLSSGQTLSVQLKFFPFIMKTEGLLDYPLEMYTFMNEPLINTRGEAPTSVLSGSFDEKISAMMDIASGLSKKDAGFSSIHDVDLATSQFDSLDSSEYFKQLCILNSVPCRLAIGNKDGALYAWVKAYNGNWVDIDVQNGVREAPTQDIAYLEPKAEVHEIKQAEDPLKMLYEGTTWIGTMGQANFLIYFIVIIVAASFAVGFLLFRKNIISRILAKKGTIGTIEVDVSGKYEVLSEDIDDPFLKEIIKRIKEKDGVVNIDQLVETMRFSKELIEDGIAYLVDQKFIKKVM